MASVVAVCISEKKGVMKAIYPDIPIGAFAENILTEGIEVAALPKGTQIIVGSTILEITQIGKECHKDCANPKTGWRLCYAKGRSVCYCIERRNNQMWR